LFYLRIDELTLEVGTKVKILEKFGDGWWKVSASVDSEAKETIGLYPSNYLLEDSNQTSTLTTNTFEKNDLNSSISPKNEKSNDALWQNLNLSRSPKVLFDTSHVSAQDPNNTKCESISSNEKEIEYVRVIYPHKARKSCEYSNPIILNELTIEPNEILKLIEDDNECLDYDKSWLKVFNCQGVTGIIPSSCVQPIIDNQLTDFVFIRRPTLQGIFGNKMWYFGNISRFETIVLFNKFATNGDFLVRDSDVSIDKIELKFINHKNSQNFFFNFRMVTSQSH
jgi:hypothetical protein